MSIWTALTLQLCVEQLSGLLTEPANNPETIFISLEKFKLIYLIPGETVLVVLGPTHKAPTVTVCSRCIHVQLHPHYL